MFCLVDSGIAFLILSGFDCSELATRAEQRHLCWID